MSIIKCLECGADVSDMASVCPKCGAPVEKRIVCEECGSEMLERINVCPKCGCPNPLFVHNQSNVVNSVSALNIDKLSMSIPIKIVSIISVIMGILMIGFIGYDFVDSMGAVSVTYDYSYDYWIIVGGFIISGILLVMTWKPRLIINILSSITILILVFYIVWRYDSDTIEEIILLTLMTLTALLPIANLLLSRYSPQIKSDNYQRVYQNGVSNNVTVSSQQVPPIPVNNSLTSGQIILAVFSTICGLSFLGYALWIGYMLTTLSEISSYDITGSFTMTLVVLFLDCAIVSILMFLAWKPRRILLVVILIILILNLLLLLYGTFAIPYFGLVMIGLSPLYLLIIVSMIVTGILLSSIQKSLQ